MCTLFLGMVEDVEWLLFVEAVSDGPGCMKVRCFDLIVLLWHVVHFCVPAGVFCKCEDVAV